MKLYAIGYSGRDRAKTWEHIKELKAIGVPEPMSVPELYELNPKLVSRDEIIHVVGNETSGEVEIVLIAEETGDIKVTVGSDHTDRSLETVSIQKSKQICDKPIATDYFLLKDIEDEWDELQLYSYVKKNGEWIKAQEGKVNAMIPLNEIFEFLDVNEVKLKNVIIYCGTVPLLNGFIYGDSFRCGIYSKKLDKKIEIEYKLNKLREQ